ncbi:hypothetical protein ACFPRL_08730 [Pseudoclavibacter helvolus]
MAPAAAVSALLPYSMATSEFKCPSFHAPPTNSANRSPLCMTLPRSRLRSLRDTHHRRSRQGPLARRPQERYAPHERPSS